MAKYDFGALVAKLDEIMKNNDNKPVEMKFDEIKKEVNCSQCYFRKALLKAGYKVCLKKGRVTFEKTRTSTQNSSSTTNNGKGKNPSSNNNNPSNPNKGQSKKASNNNNNPSNPNKGQSKKASNNNPPEELTEQEIIDFRNKINDFLNKTEAADIDLISYYMKTDLATMTDMPFYKQDRGQKPSKQDKKSALYIVFRYCELLKSKEKNFQDNLLYWLSKQQNQSMRKLSKQFNKGVWEHPIPLKYTRKILLELIRKDDFETIGEYLKFINENVPQIYLRKALDQKLTDANLKDKMPDDWDWKTDNPFARYIEAGIFEELDLNIVNYKATQKLDSNWIKDNSSSHYFNKSEQKGFILLEDSVTKIGDRAFENCSHLTSITISKFVTEIGNETFKGCTNLSEETKEMLMRKHNYTDF